MRPFQFEYPYVPAARYGWGRTLHRGLCSLINERRSDYGAFLEQCLEFKERLAAIELRSEEQSLQPYWLNSWFTGLDAVALYGVIAHSKPRRIIEIGSGNSTKFARRAIADQQLATELISIDPAPRAEVDALCDRLIRQGAENVAVSIYSELQAGDILFVDSSHRSFMNSDATVILLEVLPELNSGVLVQFHDIFLPLDYPPSWGNRLYNEQYVLAAYLLGGGGGFDIFFPSAFVEQDEELVAKLNPLWEAAAHMQLVPRNGASFWLRKR